jgi:hypothetical protein
MKNKNKIKLELHDHLFKVPGTESEEEKIERLDGYLSIFNLNYQEVYVNIVLERSIKKLTF